MPEQAVRVIGDGRPEDRYASLKARTRRFAVDVLRFSGRIPNRPELLPIKSQLARCGTSVGANYRSACRAQSQAHFISRISIVEEEADESMYWLELLAEMGFREDIERDRLHREAHELVAIMVASKKTARRS